MPLEPFVEKPIADPWNIDDCAGQLEHLWTASGERLGCVVDTIGRVFENWWATLVEHAGGFGTRLGELLDNRRAKLA